MSSDSHWERKQLRYEKTGLGKVKIQIASKWSQQWLDHRVQNFSSRIVLEDNLRKWDKEYSHEGFAWRYLGVIDGYHLYRIYDNETSDSKWNTPKQIDMTHKVIDVLLHGNLVEVSIDEWDSGNESTTEVWST